MNLHEHKEEFEELIAVTADDIGVPADAVRRDYYIVQMLQNLQNSKYAETCVFKGKTYIQEYLEKNGMQDVVTEFDLQEVKVNTLDITRTFLDKVMTVKRHAICGTLPRKVRHIYDVTVLLDRGGIQDFLKDTEQLKQLLKLTKKTDSFYLQKRNISEEYDPLGAYAFEEWKPYFNDEIRERYETLHKDLLYTSNQQSFEKAIQAFEFISHLFASIGE